MNDENKVEFTLIGARQGFARLTGLLSDMTPVMRDVAGDLHAGVERAFDEQRSPVDNTPWVSLKQSTIEARTRQGYWPGKILQRTGRLAQSAVEGHGADFAEVTFGERYGIYHQTGTKRMPARPFAGVSEQTEADILDTLSRHLRAAAGE